MDEKDIMIQGMSHVIVAQHRNNSDMERQRMVLDAMDRRQKLAAGSGDVSEIKKELEKEKDDARKMRVALQQKEALLKEWMHSHEAFKRLAKKYGKKLGLSDEQRANNYDDTVLEVAEEKPEFSNTNILKEVKEVRGLK